ncbi:MAG: alpha/beta fold hydrolase [Planctomycetota bacterium]|nr:alpha/beta fold hydrolase [Planctomycetota bacterium]
MLSRYLGLFLLLVPCPPLAAQDGAAVAVAGQGQLPAEPSADLTPADLYEVGEEAGWVIEQNGKWVGENWFRYEGAAEMGGQKAHHFTAGIRLSAMENLMPESRFLMDLWVDEKGHPVRHLLHARQGDVDSVLDLSFSGTTCVAHLVQGGVPRDFDVTVPEDIFIQQNNAIGYFELLLGLHPPSASGSDSYTLFSTNVLTAFPYEVHHDPDAEQHGFVIEDSLGETIVMDEERRKLRRLLVKPQGIVIRRTDEPLEHFEFDEPRVVEETSEFDSEEVLIEHGEVSLAGTITRPLQGEPPFPAVFFVSGSGMQDRDGRSSGLEVGTREILDRLTSDGFLVLRVDDRGAGASTGPLDGMTFDDLVADARACMNYLFEREDVDPSRVALIGHSEGGQTVPLLAVEKPEVACIVLMAAPGRNLLEIMLEQNATVLEDQGVSPEEQEVTLEQVRRALAWAASDEVEAPSDVPEGLIANLSSSMRPWLASHARQDPLAVIKRVRCPVLILQGAKDFQVSADRDAQALVAALEESGQTEFEVVVFPELDHLFKPVAGEVSRLPDYYTKRAVDEEFLSTLSAWLAGHSQPMR